jgi:hypothetical protein
VTIHLCQAKATLDRTIIVGTTVRALCSNHCYCEFNHWLDIATRKLPLMPASLTRAQAARAYVSARKYIAAVQACTWLPTFPRFDDVQYKYCVHPLS